MHNNQRSAVYISWMAGFLMILMSCLISPSSYSQKRISDIGLVKTLREEGHSAKKATLFSAIVPGWGQAYNKKFWKVPIVWAGMGAIGYFIYDNSANYNLFKEMYITISENPDTLIPYGNGNYSKANKADLLTGIGIFRKNRDLSVIVLFAWWGLNIVDANVDGHFFNFDVNEDLSLRFEPASWWVPGNRKAYGLNLVLNMY